MEVGGHIYTCTYRMVNKQCFIHDYYPQKAYVIIDSFTVFNFSSGLRTFSALASLRENSYLELQISLTDTVAFTATLCVI
jgi:hypothetical protein